MPRKDSGRNIKIMVNAYPEIRSNQRWSLATPRLQLQIVHLQVNGGSQSILGTPPQAAAQQLVSRPRYLSLLVSTHGPSPRSMGAQSSYVDLWSIALLH